MSRLTWGGTAEPVSRDQNLRHERGHGPLDFSYSADHKQDLQPYSVDLYPCYMCDHTLQYSYFCVNFTVFTSPCGTSYYKHVMFNGYAIIFLSNIDFSCFVIR